VYSGGATRRGSLRTKGAGRERTRAARQ